MLRYRSSAQQLMIHGPYDHGLATPPTKHLRRARGLPRSPSRTIISGDHRSSRIDIDQLARVNLPLRHSIGRKYAYSLCRLYPASWKSTFRSQRPCKPIRVLHSRSVGSICSHQQIQTSDYSSMSSLQALANESYGLLPPGSRLEGIPQLNSGIEDVLSGSAKLAKARAGLGLVGRGGASGLRSSTNNVASGSNVDGGA